MPATPDNDEPVIGFITIVHVPDLGHCGGLLFLNLLGRPVEFHCTAPVPENRAQRILYGRTYQTFLYCDQISLALTGKAKLVPSLLVTDRTEILPLGRLSAVPVLGITDPQSQTDAPVDPDVRKAGEFWSVESDSSAIEESARLCRRFAKTVAIDEPFQRILGAIEEAQAVRR